MDLPMWAATKTSMKRLYRRVDLGYFGESKNPVKTTAAKGGESKLVSRNFRESLDG